MKTIYAYWVALTIALVACTENEKNQLSDLPIVAHQVEVDGQEMTVCELGLLKDTIDLPLSYWVEDFETVKLDGKEPPFDRSASGVNTLSQNHWIAMHVFCSCGHNSNKSGDWIFNIFT